MTASISVEIECLVPASVTALNALAFKELVLAADEVDTGTFPALYERALMLCFARSAGSLVGVGAIKRPNPIHRQSVFDRARSHLAPASFTYELGWFYVPPAFQGNHISSRMVQKAMPWAKETSVYATSRINNKPMHQALEAHGGFAAEASDFSPVHGSVPLRLFVRR
jgi:RimJ/RimL family protein N-acetyltransferase